MNSDLTEAVPSEGRIDALLRQLDRIARDYDHYEYGLPLWNEDEGSPLHELRAAVRDWIAVRP